MHLVVHRRAEIALRSLGQKERNRTLRALDLLEHAPFEDLSKSGKLYKINTASGEHFYIYRGSPRLRVVLSRNDDIWTVEDIVDHDRLNRLLPRVSRS